MSSDRSFFDGPGIAPPLLGTFLRPTLLAAVLGCLGVLLATGLALDHQATTAAGHQARILASVVALQTDNGSLQTALLEARDTESFSVWSAAPPSISAWHEQLARVAGTARRPVEVAVLQLADTRRDTVRRQPDKAHAGALYETVTSASTPAWRQPRAYEPAMAPALLDGVAAQSDRQSGPRGDRVSGYAPVFDQSGGLMAIVRTTIPLDPALAVWQEGSPLFWLVLLGMLGLAPLAVIWVGQGVSRRLRTVGADIRYLSRSDVTGPMPDSPFAEVEALLDGFADLRRIGERDRKTHAAETAALQNQLSTASEPDDAPEIERREELAQLTGELHVAMRVADEARSIRLIDYWKNTIVIAFRLGRQFDLAPGMAATVTIGTDEQAPAVIPCVYVSSEVTDTGIEVRLRSTTIVSPSLLPTPMAQLIERRSEPRLHPPGRRSAMVAAFPIRVGRPISAELIDVSLHGMCIVVPVSHAAVSTWGTSIAIGLKVSVDQPPLRLAATICAARPHESGKTILGIELDPSTPATDRGHLHTYHHWLAQTAP